MVDGTRCARPPPPNWTRARPATDPRQRTRGYCRRAKRRAQEWGAYVRPGWLLGSLQGGRTALQMELSNSFTRSTISHGKTRQLFQKIFTFPESRPEMPLKVQIRSELFRFPREINVPAAQPMLEFVLIDMILRRQFAKMFAKMFGIYFPNS